MALLILGILLALGLVVSLVAGQWMCRLALDPGSDRSIAFDAPHNQFTKEEEGAQRERLARRQAWLDGMEVQEVTIQSEDGLRLCGDIYRAGADTAGHRWAIVCHGYGGDAPSMTGQVQPLSALGFTVLTPDARGHGRSGGNFIGMGWHDRRDIVLWARYLCDLDPDAHILLYGVSMGAATVMMAAGEADLPAQVKVVVEDCGYTSVWDEFAYQLGAIFHLPPFPVLYAADLVCRARYGWGMKQASATGQLALSHLPILCIHGGQDTFVPTRMLDAVFAAAHAPKERLLVPGAAHGGASMKAPQLYWDTVHDFVFRYLEG